MAPKLKDSMLLDGGWAQKTSWVKGQGKLEARVRGIARAFGPARSALVSWWCIHATTLAAADGWPGTTNHEGPCVLLASTMGSAVQQPRYAKVRAPS